jgi:HB1, ASXL, restriction endonuclease HTH domain
MTKVAARQAVEQVLEGKRKPMPAKAIAVEAAKLATLSGKTPEQTLAALLLLGDASKKSRKPACNPSREVGESKEKGDQAADETEAASPALRAGSAERRAALRAGRGAAGGRSQAGLLGLQRRLRRLRAVQRAERPYRRDRHRRGRLP